MDENKEVFEKEENAAVFSAGENNDSETDAEKVGREFSEEGEAAESSDIKADDGDAKAENEEVKSEEGADKNALPEKTEIVGVRFKKEGKTYYFAPNGFTVQNDDRVIVDTARGMEYGYVSVPNREVKTSELVLPLREVVRLATEEDTRVHSENVKKEIEAYNTCIALIDEYNPKMKLIDVECAFDRSKLLFYYSAEERIDFREIVKALASTFHTRIEMRQIGIRDEAKMLGGLGVCGRPFCCSAFLTDFVQVSVKMAKEQNISLNAAKISGACGKLMCCLRYEYETYIAEKALTPKVGARVMTPDGPGEVTESNPLAGIVKVRLDGKAEDAEQTVYVREDVVKEEEYTGEKLVKTELPKRGKSKEEEDVFASFANAISGASASSEEKKPEVKSKDTRKPTVEKTAQAPEAAPKKENAEGAEKATEDGEGKSDRSGGGRNRRRHRGGHRGGHGESQGGGGNAQNGQNAAQSGHVNQGKAQGQSGGAQNGGQGGQKGERGQHSGQGKNRNQGRQGAQNGQAPQGGQNAHPQNTQNGQGGQANQAGQGKKKKHFRPYHKRFGNGQGGGGQGGSRSAGS